MLRKLFKEIMTNGKISEEIGNNHTTRPQERKVQKHIERQLEESQTKY